ncbi:hypothetical protein [Hamadaea tsunoensis]|uniref:hypothetical protein n=1 Tax=Hamadaea tsunoensis TaxID=53368 RepID=UPI0004017ADB|nr:hypothetical protein [Hamadaea tsunoensis]
MTADTATGTATTALPDRAEPNSPWSRVAATAALLTVIISALLTAFAWPAARSSVHGVPIVVAGPPAAVAQVTAALDQHQPGAFTVTAVADTAAAESSVLHREAYGAIDLSSGRPQVIVASAAGPVVAQALQGVAAGLAQPAQSTVGVRDLVPLPSGDPRGAGLAAGALPLVLGGMIAAVLFTVRVRGTGRRVAGAVAYAVAGGLAMAAILQFWLGSISGNYAANAGVMALSLAATSLTVLGLESLLGTAGFALGGLAIFLLGNPLSGATSAPEMLPGWSGEVGRFLPPGAAVTLLRSVAFFHGHAVAQPIAVLAGWLALGVVLCLLGGLRTRRLTR